MGTMAACLVAQGQLDEHQHVGHYVPELTASGFGNATVRQVMDMTTGIDYTENYADPQAEIWNHMRAGGVMPRPAGYAGPTHFYDYLPRVRPKGVHGEQFTYRTANTDVLGWIVARVTGLSCEALLSQLIWQPMGAEQDAYYAVDSVGTAFAGGGLNTSLRDLARFGELMRNHGRVGDQQVLPEAAVRDCFAGADPTQFVGNGTPTLPGWSSATCGGSHTTRMGPSWLEGCTARTSTSTRKPRWSLHAMHPIRLRPTSATTLTPCPPTMRWRWLCCDGLVRFSPHHCLALNV
jgi:CubicO group peptidase (beta-lactamase class C family)